jgi:methylated-DNA-[protein]-cysteine S-methyltransferase
MWTLIPSPVGELLLSTDGQALTAIWFSPHKAGRDGRPLATQQQPRDDEHPVLRATVAQLTEYFAARRTSFDLPLAPVGSAFQQRVWMALRQIPYGQTVSYGEIARRVELPPGGSRAVGLANGANPISIVVPCHRVIGANGSLTGYGGGLDRKRLLLDLERGSLF